jgi:hypothetical protein
MPDILTAYLITFGWMAIVLAAVVISLGIVVASAVHP